MRAAFGELWQYPSCLSSKSPQVSYFKTVPNANARLGTNKR